MSDFIELVIGLLEDLRTDSPFTQFLALFGAASFMLALAGSPYWLMLKKQKAAVAQYDGVRDQRDTALTRVRQLEGDVAKLHERLPETFVAKHRSNVRDGNEERAMALAEGFVNEHRHAITLAFRTRMDESIRQSVEDGAPAFEAARRWGRAALMLSPDDTDLRALVEDVGEAAVMAGTSGARVTLKLIDPQARRAVQDRLPRDVVARDVEGVRERVETALLPEHRFFERLNDVEARLADGAR